MTPEEANYATLLGEVTMARRKLGARIGFPNIDRAYCPICYLSGYDSCHEVVHGDATERYFKAFSCGKRNPKKENLG